MTQAAGAAVARDVGRPELAASADRPRSRLRHGFERLHYYGRLFRLSCHGRLAVVNAICRPFPHFVSGAFRGRLYRWAGFSIGSGVFIMGNLEITSAMPDFYSKLVVGSGTTIADNVSLILDASITIGTNVAIAPHVVICTGNHRTGPGSMRLGHVTSSPVTIENGAWVRVGALIAPGVRVGHGSVVAAGAVVLKDVPPNTYVEGNPAQVVHRLPWGDR